MSLKNQGDAFDLNCNMRSEFRSAFKCYLNYYIDVLYKVTFILPKYIKIKEVINIIYDTYHMSTL